MRAEVSDELLTLTLDRPERRNALDPVMRDELAAALDQAARSASIRGVVITGAGQTFCAGGDLGAFDDLHDARLYRHVSHELDRGARRGGTPGEAGGRRDRRGRHRRGADAGAVL